jgi:hypothetical protein
MPFRRRLQCLLAASAMLAWPVATAQQTSEATPRYGTKQELFDGHQAHYAAMIEGFNNATGYARGNASTSPTLACLFYKQALSQLSDAQDDLKSIISLLEQGHQDAAQYHMSLDANAMELVKWTSSYANNCPGR